ncbi:MAG: ATP-binding cassette domain-containing protein [Bacteroidetes bacterium]|nr:MAG: ATP-binding cassette domain-containing protein [Bacteroidota bacterium]
MATKKEDLPKAKLNKESLGKASRIFRFIGPHKWKFFLGLFFLAGTGAVALIFPKLMGDLMGLAGKTDSIGSLLGVANTVGIQLLILFALQSIFSFFRVILFVSVTENMLAGVRQDVYNRLIRMPMSFFSSRQVSELNSRVSADISQIQETFTTSIAEFLRQSMIIIGGIAIICFTSGRLALVMLSIIPVLAILTVYFGRKIRKISKGVQDNVADSNVIVGESLLGIANVKAFTNEAHEASRYSKSTLEIVKLAMKSGYARGSFFSFIIFCLFGAIVFMVWYVVKLKVEGEISPDNMMSFLFYTVMVAGSIGGLPEQYAQIQRAVGATERVFDLLDEPIEEIDLQPQPSRLTSNPSPQGERGNSQQRGKRFDGEVEFQNISFSYPSRKDFPVLKNISFKAKKGETIALVGPSGAGKSTVTNLILRFYNPDSGKILIDGKNAQDYSLTELRSQMAIVPQDVLLFGGTIKDNIAYGKRNATMEEVIAAAQKANALSFIESFPDKFETKVGERGIQLSGGQRQRIAIARAVLKDPSILLLDEATSSLDSESERLVQEALDKLMEGRTSLVIAHRLSTIRKAGKIIVIDHGQVKESGTHEDLIAITDGLYRSLSKLQFELN